MPSPKHPCMVPNCTAMVAKKESARCRHHAALNRSVEHIQKIAQALKGQRRTVEQRQRLSDVMRGPGSVERVCGHCGATFRAEKPSSKTLFCSRECGYANRRGEKAFNYRHDMPMVNCRLCGKLVRAKAKTVPGIFCSLRCKAVWLRKHQPNKGTAIERIVEGELRRLGWLFLRQEALLNLTVVDFVLPLFNVVIYCDGDYWHRLPGKQAHDASQTSALEAAGYKVFRFWESDIKRDPRTCMESVVSYIKRGA